VRELRHREREGRRRHRRVLRDADPPCRAVGERDGTSRALQIAGTPPRGRTTSSPRRERRRARGRGARSTGADAGSGSSGTRPDARQSRRGGARHPRASCSNDGRVERGGASTRGGSGALGEDGRGAARLTRGRRQFLGRPTPSPRTGGRRRQQGRVVVRVGEPVAHHEDQIDVLRLIGRLVDRQRTAYPSRIDPESREDPDDAARRTPLPRLGPRRSAPRCRCHPTVPALRTDARRHPSARRRRRADPPATKVSARRGDGEQDGEHDGGPATATTRASPTRSR
jgi:hypothetical protein